MLLDRRQAIFSSGLFLPPHISLDSRTVLHCTDLICNLTPPSFRQAVQQQDTFLYRGNEEPLELVPQLLDPEPDLLTEGVYDDPLAIKFFQCLEQRLESFAARPSTGHIATSDRDEAGKWGEPVSVWPAGTDWAYTWPKDAQIFFPTQWKNQCDRSEFVLNQGLEDALKKKHEVLFTSWFGNEENVYLEKGCKALKSAFFIIPSDFDSQMKIELRKRNYGLN